LNEFVEKVVTTWPMTAPMTWWPMTGLMTGRWHGMGFGQFTNICRHLRGVLRFLVGNHDVVHELPRLPRGD
jgi:hypothetical protein